MTSQVILLNNSGIAIASDSASTAFESSGKYRTLNASEKIFELRSNGHKVAVLVSGSSGIGIIPVEALLTEWESSLTGPLPDLKAYSESFIQWMTKLEQLQNEVSNQKSLHEIIDNLIQPIYTVIKELEVKTTDFEEQFASYIDAVDKEISKLDDWAYYPGASKAWGNGLIARNQETIESQLNWWVEDISPNEGLAEKLMEVLRAGLGKRTGLSPSTLAFVGFGKDQLLPAYSVLEIYGTLEGVVFHRINKHYVHSTQNGYYHFLAQSDAIIAVMQGISENVLKKTEDYIYNGNYYELENQESLPEGERHNPVEFANMKVNEYRSEIVKVARNENDDKLVGLINAASESDLALLSSMFVSIQAFTALIDSPQPTVGGPIDVAVINKRDGFRWIRHKGISLN